MKNPEKKCISRRDALVRALSVAAGSVVSPLSSRCAPGPVAKSITGPVYHYKRPYDWDGVMQGFPPPLDARVTKNTWLNGELKQMRWGLAHLLEMLPTHRIAKGPQSTQKLSYRHAAGIYDMSLSHPDGRRISLMDFMVETNTMGFIAMKQGQIVAEHYFYGLDEHRPMPVFSSSKSLSSLLFARLIADNQLHRAAPIAHYLQELQQTGYKGATIDQCFNMESGIDYFDGPQHLEKVQRWYRKLLQHQFAVGFHSSLNELSDDDLGSEPQKNALDWGELDFIQTLKQRWPHGDVFVYKESDPRVLAWAAERLFQKRFADLFRDLVWSQIGPENDAFVITDAVSNSALMGHGIGVTLRDFARVGNVLAYGGRVNGRQIVPASFIADLFKQPAKDWFKRKSQVFFYGPHNDALHIDHGLAYRDFWWIWPSAQLESHGGLGQQMNVELANRVVVAKFSAHQTPDQSFNQNMMMHEIADRLGKDF